MNGAERIAAERARQIESEGWEPEHDDEHRDGSLGQAARCYIQRAFWMATPEAPKDWPWDARWWKPSTSIRMLEKAGALIAAEIDRRLRAGES